MDKASGNIKFYSAIDCLCTQVACCENAGDGAIFHGNGDIIHLGSIHDFYAADVYATHVGADYIAPNCDVSIVHLVCFRRKRGVLRECVVNAIGLDYCVCHRRALSRQKCSKQDS